MSSAADRRRPGHSLALQLAVYFSGVFGLIAILGSLLMFQLVRAHTLDEIDADILRQKAELVRILADGDCAGSLMAELIDNGLKYLPQTDLAAIAEYVAGQPASNNPARKAARAGKKRKSEDY